MHDQEILDISEYQGRVGQQPVDWDLLATVKKPVILRATIGNTSIDSEFFRNYREAKRVDRLLGVYHFADPDERHEDAKLEAAHFVRVVSMAGFDSTQQIVFVLDIEKLGRIQRGPAFCKWVIDFCEEVDRLVGCKYVCGIYTGGCFWNENDGDPLDDVAERLRHWFLWLAAYVDDPTRYVAMTPWKNRGATIHQYSGDVGPGRKAGKRYPGVTANVVDTNRFLLDVDIRTWVESLWLDDDPIVYPSTDITQAVDIVGALADTEPPEPSEPNT